MKNLVYLLFLSLLFVGCRKEKGKESYELKLIFSSGDIVNIEGVIDEKKITKKVDLRRKKAINIVYFRAENYPDSFHDLSLSIFKLENNILAGINNAYFQLDNASFAVNQSVFLDGVLEMNGEYERKGIKFFVENGTFTFNWNNASDYGEPVQELTGTWSLKRK